MQLKSITSAKEAGIPGIEFVKTDKAITEVVFGKLRIRKGESYSSSLQILIEQPFEEAKRYRMTAKIDGFDPKVSYHETSYEADVAANDLAAKGAETSVDEVTVFLNDDGEVVTEADDAVPAQGNGEFAAPF